MVAAEAPDARQGLKPGGGLAGCRPMALQPDSAFAPMEALSADAIPPPPGWQYEPKWDGFRCLAFRDGPRMELRSKSGQPLGRYFPDIEGPLGRLGAQRFVLDGELVVPVAGVPSFEHTQMRLHPAASRVAHLAAEHPAQFMLFDLLLTAAGEDLTDQPLWHRRSALEVFIARHACPALALSPATRDPTVARHWLEGREPGCDGVMAKRLDAPYRSGLRDGMLKIKPRRSADCVVGGFRCLRNSREVGSLLLGLYDAAGLLDHVGYTSTIAREARAALTRRLESLAAPPGFTGRAPGGPSRWSTDKSGDWQPVRPELVVEVAYDHVTAGRFRHGTRLLRFRPDKAARQCGMEQIAPQNVL